MAKRTLKVLFTRLSDNKDWVQFGFDTPVRGNAKFEDIALSKAQAEIQLLIPGYEPAGLMVDTLQDRGESIQHACQIVLPARRNPEIANAIIARDRAEMDNKKSAAKAQARAADEARMLRNRIAAAKAREAAKTASGFTDLMANL